MIIPEKSIEQKDLLKILLGINNLKIEEFYEKIIISNKYLDLQEINIILENTGWFISVIHLEENSKFKISKFCGDENELVYNDGYLSCEEIISATIVPYYNSLENKKIHTLYHITNYDNIESILKNGIIPSSGCKLSYHPKRVYLCNFKQCKILTEIFINNDYGSEILKINLKGLNIKLFHDNEIKWGGYYTIEKIPANRIKVLYDNESIII